MTRPSLPGIGRNRVASHSEIEKRITKRNGIAGHSEKGEEMEGVKEDMSEISFFNRGIIQCNWQKDKTLNPQVDKKKHLLARKTLRHISSSNQDPALLSSPQQEVTIMCPSGLDTRLNSVLAGIVATKGSQDVSIQLIPLCIIYTNYDHKLLTGVRKLAIL